MNKFLHISIVWRAEEKSVDQLRPIFDLAEEWVCYGGSNWILYTSGDISTWQGRVRAIISDSDSFFVCEIAHVRNSGGWLPKWVWDWIKKDRQYDQFVLPLSSQF